MILTWGEATEAGPEGGWLGRGHTGGRGRGPWAGNQGGSGGRPPTSFSLAAVTLPMLIRSLFRLTSVSSQTSASGPPEWGTRWGLGPSPSEGRPGKIGGAFSWSLRCSPCSTSSVFSRSRSPGTGVTLTTLERPGGAGAGRGALSSQHRPRNSLPPQGAGTGKVLAGVGASVGPSPSPVHQACPGAIFKLAQGRREMWPPNMAAMSPYHFRRLLLSRPHQISSAIRWLASFRTRRGLKRRITWELLEQYLCRTRHHDVPSGPSESLSRSPCPVSLGPPRGRGRVPASHWPLPRCLCLRSTTNTPDPRAL